MNSYVAELPVALDSFITSINNIPQVLSYIHIHIVVENHGWWGATINRLKLCQTEHN